MVVEVEADVARQVTATQERDWARPWLNVSTSGMSTGYESGCWTRKCDGERRVKGTCARTGKSRQVRKGSLRECNGSLLVFTPSLRNANEGDFTLTFLFSVGALQGAKNELWACDPVEAEVNDDRIVRFDYTYNVMFRSRTTIL